LLLTNIGVELKTKVGGSLAVSAELTQIGMNHDVELFLFILNDSFTLLNVSLNHKYHTKRTHLQRLTLPPPKEKSENKP
jgi:hypothetical protein